MAINCCFNPVLQAEDRKQEFSDQQRATFLVEIQLGTVFDLFPGTSPIDLPCNLYRSINPFSAALNSSCYCMEARSIVDVQTEQIVSNDRHTFVIYGYPV
ncbi:hypothetical protein CS542_03015 [Pedobacter sp. IW39]|nr:hypothetical protein CS542_03015 [Pedobacter sp. IW39]